MRSIPLRARLTLVSTLLILMLSVTMTVLLNHSANTLADTIEATPTLDAAIGADPQPSAPLRQADPAPAASARARRTYLLDSLGYLCATVVAGAALTWALTGRAMRPLCELSEHMATRTVWNLSERATVPPGDDEVASLAVSFNTMSEKLEEAFAAQKRFSQSAAHELRTPLAVLKTRLEVFRKRPDRTPAEHKALMDTFSVQIERLSRIVSDLLDLANMNEVAFSEPICIASLLDDVCEELAGAARARGVRLVVTAPAGIPDIIVAGSSGLVHRAISNLVENAIDYGGSGGSVELSSTSGSDSVTISVADHGPGIGDARKDLVFEPFYRSDPSGSSSRGNIGLGLATVRAIIERHGGRVKLSDNPGGGCRFIVTIPKRPVGDIC